MCGIFGYIGTKTNNNASEMVLQGLKRLDYRGYDSWGIATLANDKIVLEKQAGKIQDINLDSEILSLKSNIAIGHTRWATTGAVTKNNAHPHSSTDESFVLAQNGIVENYEQLKQELLGKGYQFKSETDTEVIVRLIEEEQKTIKNFQEAIRQAFLKLKGRNTIIILTTAKEIFAARNGSPLVVGYNPETQETFVSSDTLSFAPFASKAIVLENGQFIHIDKNSKLKIWNIQTNQEIQQDFEDIKIQNATTDLEGFEHYMLKEVYESPTVIQALINQDPEKYETLAEAIRKARHVYTIGSGTAGIAAAQIAFYLRHFAQIETTSLVGADANEYFDLFQKNDLIIAPSQSGETADVLEVLEIAHQKGVKIASLVNMPGSMMTRLSDFKFMAEAGPEICVMSTKVFTSQIAWGYLLAKTVSGQNHEGRKNLESLATAIQKYLHTQTNHKKLKDLAKQLKPAKDIFLLGKYQNFQIMKEGMVKLIEGSYKHAHAIPAGDLKHYAITLMEKGVPVIVAISEDSTKSDVLNAATQVRARGAEVIGIAPLNEHFDFHIAVPDTGETSAIMNIIPLQLLAYYLARELGNNIDKPRNIAKSVTVK
jgi:glucosamine--fructose-6-phosphate aminotransferase (isomerizing)